MMLKWMRFIPIAGWMSPILDSVFIPNRLVFLILVLLGTFPARATEGVGSQPCGTVMGDEMEPHQPKGGSSIQGISSLQIPDEEEGYKLILYEPPHSSLEGESGQGLDSRPTFISNPDGRGGVQSDAPSKRGKTELSFFPIDMELWPLLVGEEGSGYGLLTPREGNGDIADVEKLAKILEEGHLWVDYGRPPTSKRGMMASPRHNDPYDPFYSSERASAAREKIEEARRKKIQEIAGKLLGNIIGLREVDSSPLPREFQEALARKVDFLDGLIARYSEEEVRASLERWLGIIQTYQQEPWGRDQLSELHEYRKRLDQLFSGELHGDYGFLKVVPGPVIGITVALLASICYLDAIHSPGWLLGVSLGWGASAGSAYLIGYKSYIGARAAQLRRRIFSLSRRFRSRLREPGRLVESFDLFSQFRNLPPEPVHSNPGHPESVEPLKPGTSTGGPAVTGGAGRSPNKLLVDFSTFKTKLSASKRELIRLNEDKNYKTINLWIFFEVYRVWNRLIADFQVSYQDAEDSFRAYQRVESFLEKPLSGAHSEQIQEKQKTLDASIKEITEAIDQGRSLLTALDRLLGIQVATKSLSSGYLERVGNEVERIGQPVPSGQGASHWEEAYRMLSSVDKQLEAEGGSLTWRKLDLEYRMKILLQILQRLNLMRTPASTAP